MSIVDDEFDLDIRLSVAPTGAVPHRAGDGVFRAQTDDDTVAPAATCPADTCELGCQTDTCPEETCGCNTSETCDQHLEDCGGGFTLGPYCEDASGGEDTCDACVPAGTDVCGDPPD